jgi:plastocyanin
MDRTARRSPISRRALLRAGIAAGAVVPVGAVAGVTTLSSSRGAAMARGTPAGSPVASPAASPVAAVTVEMTSQLQFAPREVTIAVGETVTWVNASPIPHTSTADPEKNPLNDTRPELVQLPEGAEPWDSGFLKQGDMFSHTFTAEGEYHYFCIPHVLSDMLGTVKVEA